jgi:hypothetical protein
LSDDDDDGDSYDGFDDDYERRGEGGVPERWYGTDGRPLFGKRLDFNANQSLEGTSKFFLF